MNEASAILIIGTIFAIYIMGVCNQPKVIRVGSFFFMTAVFGVIAYASYNPLNNVDMGIAVIGALFSIGMGLIELVTPETRSWGSRYNDINNR